MNLLPNESILLETRPQASLPLVWLFTKALGFAVYAAGLAFIGWAMFMQRTEHAQLHSLWALVALVFVITWVVGYLYCKALARTFQYQVTSQRFIFSGGIVRRVTHAVEHRRVTDIQLSQNLVEQWRSISTINLFTPGTASVRPNSKTQPMPELRLEGLPNGLQVFELISNCVQKARIGDL